ncbi:hypothetical protein RF11_02980 [Thelohanellus kitauei]|uniref:Integrase catalytic domain-containing protein n=1 Tax=Thelohanellus kitauei TaxID=669202 RepID=A0A0C2N5D8_THEKT|nr:hypothetical protein RF11_02980 [Thelohanellus kitauei]
MDIVDPLSVSNSGNRYIFVTCDYLLKWPEAFPIQGTEAATIAKTKTTPYHPQSDGLVERFNGTLGNMIAKCIENVEQWDEILQLLMMAYKSSVDKSAGMSPYYAIFGHEIRSPAVATLAIHSQNYDIVGKFALTLKQRLAKAHNLIRTMHRRISRK